MNRPQEALLYLLRADRGTPGSESESAIRGMSNLHPLKGVLSPNFFDISSLTPDEWTLVVKEALRHGVAPYLFHKLKSPQQNSREFVVPDSALAVLRQAYFGNIAVNLQRFHFLGIALRALADAHIPVIVLKGGYLAEAVYGNIALRVMCDIDILVRRENIPTASKALRSAGYEPKEFSLDLPADANEFHFIHQKSGAMIELHWEIINSEYPFALKPEVIWPAAVPAKIANADVLALSPEDLLCHLAIHAGIHSYNAGLKAFVDCAEAIDRLPVDWRRLVARARIFRSVRPVWLYLSLARRLLGAVVPDDVLSLLCPSEHSEAIFVSALERILPDQGKRSSGDAGNPNLILLFGRKGIRAKLSLALHRAFPSRASLASLYPVSPKSPRVFLYYFPWIRDLIKRNGPAVRARFSSRRKKGKAADGGGGSAALMDWLIRGE